MYHHTSVVGTNCFQIVIIFQKIPGTVYDFGYKRVVRKKLNVPTQMNRTLRSSTVNFNALSINIKYYL